ncbi:MAG: Spy/CpxP family protein refolding chaperone [Pyrinomonadaceae bacterium]
MSLKNKFFSVLMLAFSLVVFSTFATAQDNKSVTTTDKSDRHMDGHGRGMKGGERGFGGHHRGMRGHGLRMLVRTANLTDAQKLQIQSIKAANKPTEAFRQEVRTLMMAKRDGTITAAQQERLTAIREERQAKGKAIHEQIMALLTPEQKALVEAKKVEMKQRMQERRERHQQKPYTTEAPKVS